MANRFVKSIQILMRFDDKEVQCKLDKKVYFNVQI